MQQTHASDLKEIRVHGTKSFPCAFYRTRSARIGALVKHHWHDEVEILYFSGGPFLLDINMEQSVIDSESLCFINPGELHSIITKAPDSQEDAVVFSPDLLSFDTYDTAQIHLIQPIQKGRMLFPRRLTPEHPAFAPIRDAFMAVLHSFGPACQETPGADLSAVTDDLTSQLYIKASLLYILAVLSRYQLFTPTEKDLDKRVEAIKTTLTYIKENYKEKIYISDLAREVNLNEQYFCRFFKKAIGRTPMEYVNEYRIKQTRRLLEETDLSVTDVCLECGYNNLGNFLREFRKQTGTTPLQYRKQCQRSADQVIIS